jgi:ABC-type multidrug transport system ATPase subunit
MFISFWYIAMGFIIGNIPVTSAKADGVLSWDLTVNTKAGKQLLRDVQGSVAAGELHAIMGPSGSGKSTLLNCLASVVPKGSLSVVGSVETSFEDVQLIYVQQEDLLFPQLTVQETLDTSFAMQMSHARKDDAPSPRVVDSLLRDLGLKKVAAVRVGDSKTRGISGGEKKRLSIGNEIVRQIGTRGSDRKIIFADEPTSGLDSFQAQQVMLLLKKLARDGNIVIASIHQPRYSIYQLFDSMTLLSEGRVMFSGSTSDVASYFRRLGHPVPPSNNPAEFFIDLISTDFSSAATEADSKEKQARFAAAVPTELPVRALSSQQLVPLHSRLGAPTSRRGLLGRAQGAIQSFSLLFVRAARQVLRDKPLNIARLSSSLFSSLLFGAIYFKLGKGASTVADRLGLLQVAAVNTAMTSLIKATTSFVSEKLIVQRERRANAYGMLPYFLSKMLAEIPVSAAFPTLSAVIMYKLCGLNDTPGRLLTFVKILVVESMAATAFGMAVGSLAPSPEAAVAIAPALMVVFIVFGGLYVVNTPNYLKYVPRASLIRWAYEALCVNEFKGLELKPEKRIGPLSVSSGQQVLEGMGYGKSTVGYALKAQAMVIAANYLFTYVSLVLQRPSSEHVQSKEAVDEKEELVSGPAVVADASGEGQEEAKVGTATASKTGTSPSSPTKAQRRPKAQFAPSPPKL